MYKIHKIYIKYSYYRILFDWFVLNIKLFSIKKIVFRNTLSQKSETHEYKNKINQCIDK